MSCVLGWVFNILGIWVRAFEKSIANFQKLIKSTKKISVFAYSGYEQEFLL